MRPLAASSSSLLLLLCLGSVVPLRGQAPPSFLADAAREADAGRLLPHRLELEETTRYANDSTDVDSYTFVTVDGVQNWGEAQIAIDWMALTWNGTGFDRNVVATAGLDMRGRITPSGIPFGYLVGSHYFEDSNVVDANPDGELHRYHSFRDTAVAQYNEIVLPYLLASMDLREGMRLVVPTFSEYRARSPRRYTLLVVRGRTTVEDEHGHRHRGWRVDGAGTDTFDEARELDSDFPEAHRRYFVSGDPPYFLGKEWVGRTDPEGRRVDLRWRLVRHQLLDVGPATRIDAIQRVRARRAAGQVVPWQRVDPSVRSSAPPPPSGPGSGR